MAYNAKTNWVINETVQPEDLNRMEKGIRDAHTNKAESTLENVANSTFSSKAKSSGLDVPGSSNITYYVSPGGNDTTGTGTQSSPFKTLQKAVDSFPDSNPKGVIYDVVVSAGTYTGFTLRANKHIWISPEDIITVGKVSIYDGAMQVYDEVIFNEGVAVYDRGLLMLDRATITKTAGNNAMGVLCQSGGMFIVNDSITISNFSIGVNCTLAQAFISSVTISNGTTGVACNTGQVFIGENSISTTSKFVVSSGGRIFADGQTIIQQ